MPNFRIVPLEKSQFEVLFALPEAVLAEKNIQKMYVNAKPGFPCRVSLQDAELGEEVLLLPYKHHSVNSPYQAEGPIFVRKNAQTAQLGVNEVPKMLLHRLLSLRAYAKNAQMVEASVVEGKDLSAVLDKMLENQAIDYIHIHNAKPGCYNCQVERVLS
jgi:hypothetical protein